MQMTAEQNSALQLLEATATRNGFSLPQILQLIQQFLPVLMTLLQAFFPPVPGPAPAPVPSPTPGSTHS